MSQKTFSLTGQKPLFSRRRQRHFLLSWHRQQTLWLQPLLHNGCILLLPAHIWTVFTPNLRPHRNDGKPRWSWPADFFLWDSKRKQEPWSGESDSTFPDMKLNRNKLNSSSASFCPPGKLQVRPDLMVYYLNHRLTWSALTVCRTSPHHHSSTTVLCLFALLNQQSIIVSKIHEAQTWNGKFSQGNSLLLRF